MPDDPAEALRAHLASLRQLINDWPELLVVTAELDLRARRDRWIAVALDRQQAGWREVLLSMLDKGNGGGAWAVDAAACTELVIAAVKGVRLAPDLAGPAFAQLEQLIIGEPVMKVMIIGGGIGGLALTQGLLRHRIDVEVYERDIAVGSRWEGYRLHINPAGARALHACLPAAGWQEFRTTAGPGGSFGFLTERLANLVVVEESTMYPGGATDPAANHYAADRATLRRLLSSGLDDVLHSGAEFVGYEVLSDGRVRVHFADGRTASADLLVGADGVNSRVRRQLLPTAATIDTDAVGIAHKIWLTEEVRTALPAGYSQA